MKQLVTAICLLLIAAGCKKEKCQHLLCDDPNIENSLCTSDSVLCSTLIMGRWDWTQTISGWTLASSNPCTDSIQRSYEFMNNGVVQYYENGQLLSTGTYSLSNASGLSLHAQDSLITFALDGWFIICDDYMIVNASPVDGAKVTLKKEE